MTIDWLIANQRLTNLTALAVAVHVMRLGEFSGPLKRRAGNMPFQGWCIPPVQLVVLIYFKKLNKITLVLSIAWNAFVFAITPLIIGHFAISPEAKNLVIWLVLINNIFNGLAYPFAGPLGNGLRAAGDVKFTMIVSVSLTIAARLFFSALFGLWMGLGVIGVAIGMSIDLVIRGTIFLWRQKSQKWTQFQLI